jgi:hypothetical protein
MWLGYRGVNYVLTPSSTVHQYDRCLRTGGPNSLEKQDEARPGIIDKGPTHGWEWPGKSC